MINPLNKFPNLEIYQKKIGIPNNPYTIVNNLPSGVTGTMSPYPVVDCIAVKKACALNISQPISSG